jgi:hypothetical protein
MSVRNWSGLGVCVKTVAVVPGVLFTGGWAGTKRSAIDVRTTRHAGYAASLRVRKRIEEAFGSAKSAAALPAPDTEVDRGVRWQFTLAMAAYNLVRLPKLVAASP